MAVSYKKLWKLLIDKDMKKKDFYRSIILVCDGIIKLANRYSEKAKEKRAAIFIATLLFWYKSASIAAHAHTPLRPR